MRKTLFLACLISFFVTEGTAQFKHGPVFGAGYSINGFNTDPLNNFVRTFNEYYTVDMKQPLNDYSFSTMNGFYISAGWRFMQRHRSGFSGSVVYNYGYNSNTKRSIIWNNSGYDFNLEFYNHDFMFEGGYQVKGIFFAHALFGITIRQANMEVWKVYPDGSRSMGYEYDINGFYQGLPCTIELGGSVGFRVWHFFLPFRISYGLPFSTGQVALTDYDVNRWRAHEFPNDYGAWLANTTGESHESNTVSEDSFSGLRLHFGVEFMLPVFK